MATTISNSTANLLTTTTHDRLAHNSPLATNDGTFVIWLYAFISVIIISVCGLVPIVCMPRIQRSRYQNDLLQFLIGLAIGTLTADALLHLLPISGHRHSHGTTSSKVSQRPPANKETGISGALAQQARAGKAQLDYHENAHHHNDDDEGLDHLEFRDQGFYFGLMALVGIIGFLVLERLMLLLTDLCTHKEHTVASVEEGKSSPREEKDLQMTDSHQNHQHPHQNHHQHQHHHLTNKTKSFMFMIITGDGLHNFFDGVAIGVSYGSSLTVGLSTSIAILCHELPHEIGDFAVLIKSGMPIKRAVLYNTLSSILCLLGATLGAFIGKIDVGWVSALIAGMFLYISLVDMVPQLDCYPTHPAPKRAMKLFIQISGISLGVAIMSLIATYESKFHSLISAYKP